MQKVWLTIRQKRRLPRGFSVVEVILAATVFGFLVTALSGAMIYGRSGTATAGERLQALALAEEGVEATRSMRDGNYSLLADGPHGLITSGSPLVWNFSGTFDDTGIFRRVVNVSTVDSKRKAVTSTVSWTNNGVTRQVTATTRLTNWRIAFATTGPVMMAYSKTTTTPFYRTWNGTTWSAEGSANAVVGNINYVVLKSSRTRNEAILGTQTSTGAVYVQVWNGTAWGAATLVGTGPTTTRSFDIAYEKSGDRAVVVYSPSAASADFAYRIWNGTTLSSATTITTPPTTGAINWIELRQNPLSASNEIAMMLLDANVDVYGMVWTGSAWSTMGTAVAWDTTAAIATKKTIDIEYEQTSGEAMFMWGDGTTDINNYRTWNGTTLSSVQTLTIAAQDGVSEWVQLAARPSSNEIMLGVQDANATPDLNTRKWSGSAWDTAIEHPEHSAGTENVTSRNFDIVWETYHANLGNAWLMWGDSATVTKKVWSAGVWGSGSVLTGSDDTSFLRLRAHTSSGAVFAGLYEDSTSATDDIWESRLVNAGSAWSAKNSIWAGPTGATPVFFRIDISTP